MNLQRTLMSQSAHGARPCSRETHGRGRGPRFQGVVGLLARSLSSRHGPSMTARTCERCGDKEAECVGHK
eukprot:scaffold472_cov264-Pinguiococcus_pyrenoidosus.AAC.10